MTTVTPNLIDHGLAGGSRRRLNLLTGLNGPEPHFAGLQLSSTLPVDLQSLPPGQHRRSAPEL